MKVNEKEILLKEVVRMKNIELEQIAAKCFPDFETYWKKRSAFIEDYIYFELYMKRNRKSDIEFVPSMQLRSLSSVVKSYSHNEEGLERAFCVYHIVRQLILEMQEWNTPVFEKEEHDKLLRYAVRHEWVDIEMFCKDFISCAIAYPNIREQIEKIVNE